MIRALLFDLDDTLLDHTGAARDAVDQWCRELGLPEGQHARFAAIERTWFSAYERGEAYRRRDATVDEEAKKILFGQTAASLRR